MGLKIKIVNIMGVHKFLGKRGGGGHKNNIYGKLPEKGWAWTIYRQLLQRIWKMVFLKGGGGGWG